MSEGRAEKVFGIAMISPNFRIRNPTAGVLTLPGARLWVPPIFGRDRSFAPQNDRHALFWTTTYPTEALFQMAALVELARNLDVSKIAVPALFLFADTDQVVDHSVTRDVASRWGGPVRLMVVTPGPNDDPFHHVIAGDILSPGMNGEVRGVLVDWIGSL
jgi:pimeloyl-ACP methyl ester carboxylesterase